MTDIRTMKLDLDKAKRDEQRARGEMSRCETQSNNQQVHMESLLAHREECVHGLRTAKESGLNIVQIREYQLLLKHLDGVVKEQQEKVDICQVKYEKAHDEWIVKNEHLGKMREMMQEAEQEDRERRELEMNGGEQVPQDGTDSYGGLTGRRLKTS